MPLINYVCGCGEVQKKYFKSAQDAPLVIKCKCEAQAKRTLGSTSSSHKIIIDNGLMAKAVELQSPDIMEINDERSNLDLTED